MKLSIGMRVIGMLCGAVVLHAASTQAAPVPQAAGGKFEVSFPGSAHAGSITGRVFVVVSTTDKLEPRLQAGSWGDSGPFFGVDVNALAPEQAAVIDASTPGSPVRSLREIPAGDYYVQALVNIYTEFHRADGHTVWLHMDQWEGQHFNRSPGNLYSEVQKVHLDPTTGFDIKLSLTKEIPPVQVPADTAWVKHIKIQSEMLTKFWGRPMFIGAVVLLPKGYDEHSNAHFPVIYDENHFSLRPPLRFTEENPAVSPEMRAQVQARAVGGNSVTEVLQVMLLNNIKTKHPASQIVAMDWARGVAVVELSGGGMAAVHFDPSTLQIKS